VVEGLRSLHSHGAQRYVLEHHIGRHALQLGEASPFGTQRIEERLRLGRQLDGALQRAADLGGTPRTVAPQGDAALALEHRPRLVG
jgi:hypothetical protein